MKWKSDVMTIKKLQNPFTSQPEPDVKFWTAKSKAMKDFREFFEVTCMSRTGPANIAVVGDVGSGKTRLFLYLREKFRLDTSKIVCYVNLHDVFNELKSRYFKEIDVRFLEIFYNKIFQQLESTYDSVLKEANSTEEQKNFAKRIISLLTENKRKIIEPRLKRLAVLRRMIEDKAKKLGEATSKEAKEELREEMETLQTEESELLREEVFTPKEFHSFLEIFLEKANRELGIDVFTLYVDELERITEMERDYNLPLKSTAESDLRDHLLAELGPKGLKIIVACTRKAWMNFTERFHSSFPPKEIPSLEREDLQEAIVEHLGRVHQEKFNPFTEPNAVNLIAYYSYRNFRTCMTVLRYCYDEYVRHLEKGETDWRCTLRYVVENHFDKLIRFQLYNECIRMLEKQFFPKYKRAQIERWVHRILVQFEEFDYETLWKNFKYEIDNKQEFDSFVTTLRNTGVVSEIRPNVYIVMRENFAIEEPRRDPTDEKFLAIFFETSAGKNEVDKALYFNRLRSEGFDDVTIGNRLRGLSDILQPTEDKVLMIGAPPGALDTIKGIIRDAGRQSPKIKVENESKQFAPYIIKEVWGWEATKYKDQDNIWLVSFWYDPATAGAISRKVPGVVLFRDCRYERPSPEDALKNDIRSLSRILGKARNLQFGLVICVYNPPLPTTFLGLPRVRGEELQKIRDTPILWKRLFGADEGVFGTENRVMKEGYDLTYEETKIKLSNLIFVLPIYPDSVFPEGSKLENEKIVDYVLARERILSVFRQSDVDEKFLKPALTDIKSIIVNPVYDKFLKDLLDVTWEIDLPIKNVPDKSAWPQRPEKRKWLANENTLKILDGIALEGLVKVDSENLQIAKSLTNTGLFDYRGGKEIEEIILKQDTTLNGKFVPKQFDTIFNVITDEPNDAADIFVEFLKEHAAFKSEVPDESLLVFDVDKLKAADKTRSLIASVDAALYIMSKMFPKHIVQIKRPEDDRFTYKLLKVKIDPESFIKDVQKLGEVISFLVERGFKLQKENDELQDLQKISKRVEAKLNKALEAEAVSILAEENESKITGKKQPAHARCHELYSATHEELRRVKEAFCAYPTIMDWLKNPYCEEYNEQGLVEKENLLPLPNEIKQQLIKIINAWLESEDFAKEEIILIRKRWETELWSKLDAILSEEAEKVINRIEGIKAQMGIIPNITSVSEQLIKVTVLAFDDYMRLLKTVKGLRKVALALTAARVNIEGGEGISEFARRDVSSYNAKVVEACLELIRMTKNEIDDLKQIFSEIIKIDECKADAEKYNRALQKATMAFSEDYGAFVYAVPNKKEIIKRIDRILQDLVVHQQYGLLILQVLASDAKNKHAKTLKEALINTKFAEYEKKLEKIEKFCNAYNIEFREKDFWNKKRKLCKDKYDLYAESYIEGIWQRQDVIRFNGAEIKDITAFKQFIDRFNEERVEEIIQSIPKELDEPYSTILKEIKEAHERKEIFQTVLALMASEKIRRKLKQEEVLQFLREVEKFGLLW